MCCTTLQQIRQNSDSEVNFGWRGAGHGMLCSASRSFSKPDASTLVALTSLHGWVAICTASVKGASVGHTEPGQESAGTMTHGNLRGPSHPTVPSNLPSPDHLRV